MVALALVPILVESLKTLQLPLTARCGVFIGSMMHSLLAAEAVVTSLIRVKMIYHSKLHLGLTPFGDL